jgi:hypothetical protein
MPEPGPSTTKAVEIGHEHGRDDRLKGVWTSRIALFQAI